MSGGPGNERFRLQWNEFQSNVTTSFKELRDDSEFFDVTLACDSNRQLEAHKVILSACSPFFRSVLKSNPHSHPLLYLKGIKYEDVLAVLNFMYHGEVNIAQSELNSFLTVAEDLQVKGLTQGTATHFQPDSVTKPPQEHRQSPNHASKPPPTVSADPVEQATDVVEVEGEVGNTIKTEPLQSVVPFLASENPGDVEYGEEEYHYDGPNYQDQEDVDLQGRAEGGAGDPYVHLKPHCTRAKEGAGYVCLVCTKKGRDMYQMRQHIESAHPHLSREYQCPMCGHQLNSYMKWKMHTKKDHGKIINY